MHDQVLPTSSAMLQLIDKYAEHHKISNPVVTGNYGMMHSKSSVCDPICMTIHMYCESCEWQQVEFMTALNISNHQ